MCKTIKHFGAKLLSDVSGGLALSSNNILHFQTKILLLHSGVVKHLKNG